VAALRAQDIARVLRNGLLAALFAALVLLPAGLTGNWYSLELIVPKVFATVCTLSLLSFGTRWSELTGALKYFFIPDLFIFVLDIAIKYILLLGEFALHMLWALKLRSVGENPGKHSSLPGIAGTMFLRSREMAAEMHSAMECRGFSGEYKRPARFAFNAADALISAAIAAGVLLFIYLGVKS
jgi:cobalt/nickel transport system permease protein